MKWDLLDMGACGSLFHSDHASQRVMDMIEHGLKAFYFALTAAKCIQVLLKIRVVVYEQNQDRS